MAKLSSLDDLRALLSDEERAALEQNQAPEGKRGYDGKQQRLDVRLDSKRRRGKVVTLVTGFQSNPQELAEIAATLKKSCGAGGTVGDNTIEIQGDHRTVVVERLRKMGYMVK